jgi:WD40 repeat protein
MIAVGNGLFVAAGDDPEIRILNAYTADIPFVFDETVGGHISSVNALALFSNCYLASGSFDTTINIWYINSYSLVDTFGQQKDGHSNPVTTLAVLDNNCLASGSIEGTIPHRKNNSFVSSLKFCSG